MRKLKIASAIIVAIVLIAIAVFAVPIFSGAPSSNSYYIYEQCDLYIDTIANTSPEIAIEETKFETTIRDFALGDNIAVYNTTAAPLIEADENYTFIPHYTQTIVIAIDRQQTDVNIESFKDLISTNLPINFDFGGMVAANMWEYQNTHYIVAAMAQALYGEYDIDAVAQDFEEIYSENRFLTDDMSTAVIVTTDSVAVSLIKSGRDIEIIIPSDGTLSFDFGAMVYNDSISFSEELGDSLIEAGFRLPDGSADMRYYPSPVQYDNARYIEDISDFNYATTLIAKTLRRDSFSTRLYGFVNSIELTAFFLPLLFVTICYMISIRHRISDVKIRNQLFTALALLLLFISTGLLKSINSNNSFIETALWYSYYIPILIMPALFVKVALLVGRQTQSKKVKMAYRIYFTLTFLPLLLVFTNNFHSLVFIIDDYYFSYFTHNIGYYFVMAWVALSVIFAYSMLVYKSITNPRKQVFIIPAFLSVFLIIYAVLRASHIPLFSEFDLTFAVTIMVMLYIESCIQSRLFPTNKGYIRFFKHSNLAMEITNNNGETVYKSLVTKDVNENFIKRSNNIVGGVFYYFEDYTAINTAEAKLSVVNNIIKKNNEFLLQKQEVKANLASLSAEKIAYDSIDNILMKGTELIRYYIEQIANGGDKKKYMFAINVCATIMKRNSMFRINALYQDSQPISILVNSFSEVRELAENAGIKIVVRCAVTGNLSTANISVIFAFFTSAIERAENHNCKSFLIQIYENNADLIFSIVADNPLYINDDFPRLPKYKAEYTLVSKAWEESEIYLLTFKNWEEQND